jgi:hypothetical protein
MITGDKIFNTEASYSFWHHHDICCKTGIRNNDSAQLSNIPYTQYSSENRSALNSSEYGKNINFYGRLKICLQPNVSVTTNHSRRFKCHDVTVTENRAEGLILHLHFAITIWITDKFSQAPIMQRNDRQRM